MKRMLFFKSGRTLLLSIVFYQLGFQIPLYTVAQTVPQTFEGEKSGWHGFDRFDFIMDEETLAITPFKAPAEEKDAVGTPQKGKRRCIVVVPSKTAAGKPWSWQGCYWNHEPQTEVEY